MINEGKGIILTLKLTLVFGDGGVNLVVEAERNLVQAPAQPQQQHVDGRAACEHGTATCTAHQGMWNPERFPAHATRAAALLVAADWLSKNIRLYSDSGVMSCVTSFTGHWGEIWKYFKATASTTELI